MSELLRLREVAAGYGQAVVISDVTLTLERGQALAILGRNGTGKTTLINTIVGVTRLFAGTIELGGSDVTTARPEQRAVAGIGWVPQERNVFKSLTVLENLTAVARRGPWTVERVYRLFPRLAQRSGHLGGQLSGGEQQMLAIGRALVVNPKVLLLDEPTEGLAPIIVEELLRALTRLFRDEGMAGLIVEQHAQKILAMTQQAVILDRGRIVYAGESAALRNDPAVLEHYLGVARRGSGARMRIAGSPR